MELEDTMDTYETEDDMADEFGATSDTFITKAKKAAKAKADETISGVKERIKEEQDYRAYKKSMAKEERIDFPTRLTKEKERKDERAAKRSERRAQIKSFARETVSKIIADAKKPQGTTSPGGGLFDMPSGGSKEFSLFGEKRGSQSPSFDVFGQGADAKQGGFSLFGESGGKGFKGNSYQFDIFEAGTPKTFNQIGFGGKKKGKKRKRTQEFSLW